MNARECLEWFTSFDTSNIRVDAQETILRALRLLAAAEADALEELAEVKKAMAESCDEQRGEYFGCQRAERAESALAESERKCERLKFHAEGMWLDLKTIAHEEQYALAKSAADYRADKDAK